MDEVERAASAAAATAPRMLQAAYRLHHTYRSTSSMLSTCVHPNLETPSVSTTTSTAMIGLPAKQSGTPLVPAYAWDPCSAAGGIGLVISALNSERAQGNFVSPAAKT